MTQEYIPWYPESLPQLVEYQAPTGVANLPEPQPTTDVSQLPSPLPAEEVLRRERELETARRGFVTRHEPLLPANQLGDSLSGLGMPYDTWRDVIDATILLTTTPATGSGTTDTPFVLDNPPSATYSGLSSPLQQLLRDVRTPRLALIVRQIAFAGASTALQAPSAAPAMTTAAAGGTIAAGTYTAAYTYVDAAGETQGSTQEAITTTGATSTITWTIPALPPGATTARFYLSAVGGGPLFLQGTGAGPTFTLTAPPVTSGVPELPTTNTTTAVTGNVIAQLSTSSGDTLPLGAFAASSVGMFPLTQLTGPTPMTNLSGTQHLQLLSFGVNVPVAVTFQIGFSFLAVHPHSLVKRFSQLALNQ